MKSRLILILIIAIQLGIIIFLRWPAKKEGQSEWTLPVPEPYEKDAHDPESDGFNRGDLIRRVEAGDHEAAYLLGRHYDLQDIPEAALFWFKKATVLGTKGMSSEFLEKYETTIIGRDAPKSEEEPERTEH